MLSPGTRIDDRHDILDTLGSGGMGHVYPARRVRLRDEVAVEVTQASQGAPSEAHERFLRESRAAGGADA